MASWLSRLLSCPTVSRLIKAHRFQVFGKAGCLIRTPQSYSNRLRFGYKVQVANAPAIHPTTGRLFITAAGPKESEDYTGVLYGLDITDDGVEIAFSTKMGGGSGTSPALSPDGQYVYSADGSGHMLAVNTDDGSIVWAAQGEGLLSPAIGGDGTIYTGDIFWLTHSHRFKPEQWKNKSGPRIMTTTRPANYSS